MSHKHELDINKSSDFFTYFIKFRALGKKNFTRFSVHIQYIIICEIKNKCSMNLHSSAFLSHKTTHLNIASSLLEQQYLCRITCSHTSVSYM